MTIVVAGENRLAKDNLVSSIQASFKVNTLALDKIDDVVEAAGDIGGEALVLLDYEMGAAAHGLQALRQRLHYHPQVALYSAPGNADEAMRCLNLGYDGYMPRTMSASAIVCAIQLMMRGERFVPSIAIDGGSRPLPGLAVSVPMLSPRQTEILGLVATGASNKHIARALQVEEVTVKSHVKAIFRKLGVHTRTEAARYVLTGNGSVRRVEILN